MKLFLDTSTLFKLYHKEIGTKELELLFSKSKITTIYLSEISKVEFTSTIWKKVRSKEITEKEAKITLALFDKDLIKFSFVATDSMIIENAKLLVSKYGIQGLRTLDGIQLSSALTLFSKADIFLTSDKLLNSLFELENLPTKI